MVAGGVPGVLQPGLDGGGVPGYPPARPGWWGGTPQPGLDGGGLLRVPPGQDWMVGGLPRVPH